MPKRKKFFLIGGIVLVLILTIVVWQGIRFWNLIGQYLEMKRSAEMMNQFQTLNLPKQEIPTFQEWYKERQAVLRAGRGLWWETLKYEIKRRSDRHGGKTPEQTWQMFIEALKKGDLDLASKFFVLERQEEYKVWFSEKKDNNELNEFIEKVAASEFKKGPLTSDDPYIVAEYWLIYDKELGAIINFVKDSYTQKWKIQSF